MGTHRLGGRETTQTFHAIAQTKQTKGFKEKNPGFSAGYSGIGNESPKDKQQKSITVALVVLVALVALGIDMIDW